jgi:hypothetical protein
MMRPDSQLGSIDLTTEELSIVHSAVKQGALLSIYSTHMIRSRDMMRSSLVKRETLDVT